MGNLCRGNMVIINGGYYEGCEGFIEHINPINNNCTIFLDDETHYGRTTVPMALLSKYMKRRINMFRQGDSVKIISDSYGKFSRINGIIMQQGFVPDNYFVAVIDPDNGETISLNIPGNHLSLISEVHEIIAPIAIPVDISKYLSENQMKDIAARVYEERITKFVDDVLERRTPPYGGIVDQILMATVERYVTKLAVTFEDAFLAKAKECVELKDPGNDEHTTFQEQLTFKLANAADKYIDENLPKIHDIMASTINDAATKLQINDISTKIARKIDLSKIISEIILEQSSI